MTNFEKFCEDELINKVLNELKNELDNNKIFISEVDLQFSFAKKLYELQNKKINIILEYPITTENLYSKAKPELRNIIKDSLKEKYEKIDLFFKYEDTYYFIEFKYKSNTMDKSNTKDNSAYVSRYDDVFCNEFCLKMHGADDLGRYSVYGDLERLENIKKFAESKSKDLQCKAFIIFITNHKAYWERNQTEGKLACNMPLAIKDNKYTKKGKLQFGNDNNATQRRTLFIENQYELHWNDFKTLDYKNKKNLKNTLFRCLVIDLQQKST